MKRKKHHFLKVFPEKKEPLPKSKDLLAQYRKERKRVTNAVARLKKQASESGFVLDEINIPNIPKKITEGSIRRLKNQFSTQKIRSKAEMYSPETGEIITGKQLQNLRRREGAEKRKRTASVEYELPWDEKAYVENDVKAVEEAYERAIPPDMVSDEPVDDVESIVDNFMRNIFGIIMTERGYQCASDYKDFLDEMVSKYGEEAVARAISQAPEFDLKVLYNNGGQGDKWMSAVESFCSALGEETPEFTKKDADIDYDGDSYVEADGDVPMWMKIALDYAE